MKLQNDISKSTRKKTSWGLQQNQLANASYAKYCDEAGYPPEKLGYPFVINKNADVYSPDRPLPNTPDGVHIPETDASHTQLGTKEGRKGKYPQAREFDEKGNPVRDIDFTDHERPQNHPNPHQHEHKLNPTGGTRIRDPKGQPISGWDYS